jgi:hypothetical protein
MSTEWRYQCMSHNPPMCAYPDDIGNPTKYDMTKALDLRADISAIPSTIWDEYQYDLPAHIRWVHDHPRCALEIVSEYGEVMHRIEATG